MTKKKKTQGKYQIWIDAKKRHKLSDTHIQMVRELGLNPKKLGKLDNHKQEPWKAPLRKFIEELYFKRFGKKMPDVVKPIKQVVKEQDKKKHQVEHVQKVKADFEEFKVELERLEERQQELIKTIVEKIYEALKEKNIITFASTPDCINISEEVLRAAYHISNLTWKHEK